MKNAQKPDHVSLNTLIEDLKNGRYSIPNFQREFEWKPWDIRELVRSIFLDYYIGSLLIWKGKPENFKALSCENVYGFSGQGRREYIVLDGQQRLTALHYVFLAPNVKLPGRSKLARYIVRVDRYFAEDFDGAFDYLWDSKGTQSLLSDQERQFSEHVFPLSIVSEDMWGLSDWFRGYEQYWRDIANSTRSGVSKEKLQDAKIHAENASVFGKYTRDLLNRYQVSYIELDSELELDKICDIFTQVNSRGLRLDVFDLLNAMLVPQRINLKHWWRIAQPRLDFVDSEKMNVYVLQVMSILRQVYCSPKFLYFLVPGQAKTVIGSTGLRKKEVLVQDVADFQQGWDDSVNAIEKAINLLRHPQEFGAISSKYLPYVSIIPVFSALQAQVEMISSEKRLKAQKKIRRWYWASVFTNRYSGSVESTSSRDFLDIKLWFDNDKAEPNLIREVSSAMPLLELRKEIKRGTSVYNGIFNLIVLGGARDWIIGNVFQGDDLDDHHIVPKSWGLRHLGENVINTILNRTPLTGYANRVIIKDRLPNQYFPEMIDKNGRNKVISVLETHFISSAALDILLRKPFTPNDYEEFISERRLTIASKISKIVNSGEI